jgi:RNA polymerase sigma factor (sigma-70 family)
VTTARLEPFLRHLRQTAGGASALADAHLLARFAATRDEGAFAALVRRHGPLVLGVCRRVLGDAHAAEDAFQATFLVLAKKAGSLARPESLSQWLHGVAYRTAARARAEAARRRRHEDRAAASREHEASRERQRPEGPPDDLVWRDLRPVLDEEVSRLPARYRDPVVLCYLEGRTNAEAARRLGCSRGTVATRLARARERLRRRLTGRGLALPAGLALGVLAQETRAAVPAALEAATAKAATIFAAGAVSAPAASLAEGVARAMMVQKLKTALVFLSVMALGAGGGLAAFRARAEEPPPAQPVAPPPPVAEPVPAIPPPIPPAPAEAGGSHRTANFAVTAPTAQIAEQVGRAAERARKELALLWLGKEMPDWPEPCPIHVRLTSGGLGGATSFSFDRGKVTSQNMHLEGGLDSILADSLPHEVAHTILAHWAGKPLPRWADEGVAIAAESAASRARHRGMLRKLLDEGRRMPLRRLLELREFPQDVMVLYVEGYSLTDFLVESGGRAKFLDFVAQGQDYGWAAAARVRYGYETLEEMEEAWLEAARARGEKKLAREGPGPDKPRGRLPAGPPPAQALVVLEGSRLKVWRVLQYYEPRTTYAGNRQAVTSYELVSAVAPTVYNLDEVRVFDGKGAAIDVAELPRLLKGETLVLVAADGRPVDPLHLRLVKEGTLLFVLPGGPVPPAPPAPPAGP